MILIWDISDEQELFSLPFGTVLNKVTFSQDGHALSSCGNDFYVVTWSVATGEPVAKLNHQAFVYDVAYSPDGARLATGDIRGVITVWDTRMNRRVQRWQGHQSIVRALAYSPDGRLLASGGLDGIARIWNADLTTDNSGQSLMELKLIASCQGMRIGGARGLDAPAPDREGSLRDWLIARGALD
jgi:WD40 repeat protein